MTTATTAIAKINLAPEVYQNSQRDKRHRQLANTIGSIIAVVAVAIVAVTALILGGQAVAIKLLTNTITSDQNKVATYASLPNAVTAQQHLTSWEQLNQQKVYLSRFFSVLQQVAPQGIAVTNLSLDQSNNLQITATSPSYSTAAKFAQALAASNTTVGTTSSASQQSYFSNVQLAALNLNQPGQVGFQLTTTMSNQVTSNGTTSGATNGN